MLDTPHLVLQRRPEESMRIVEEFLLRPRPRRRQGRVAGTTAKRGGPPLAERPSGASRSRWKV